MTNRPTFSHTSANDPSRNDLRHGVDTKGPKSIEETFGDGAYSVNIIWHHRGFDSVDGGGESMYEIKTNLQNITGGFNTLQYYIEQNTTDWIRSIDISPRSLYLVIIGRGYSKDYISKLAMGCHFSGLAYINDASKWNKEDTPILFGSWNKNRIFKYTADNIILDDTLNEYRQSGDVSVIGGLKNIKFPDGEYNRNIVNLIYKRKIIGSICLFDTPDFGYGYAEMYKPSGGSGYTFNMCHKGKNWYTLLGEMLNDNEYISLVTGE